MVVEVVTSASAAEKAGVKAGDVVVQFDGENVRSAAQFTRLVRETVAGRSVKMGVVRDGKRVDLDVAPAEAENVQQFSLERRTPAPGGTFTWEERVPAPGQSIPPMPPTPPAGAPRRQQRMPMPDLEGDTMQWFGESGGAGNFVFSAGRGRLGVNVQDLTPELAAYFGVKDGLLVNSVQADTPAAKAGIKAGDVIGTVNGKAVLIVIRAGQGAGRQGRRGCHRPDARQEGAVAQGDARAAQSPRPPGSRGGTASVGQPAGGRG